ncbi:putative hydroxybutyrate dehydrogenase [Xylariomycetidae sp. FL0641]|nr:putative hydroxybutyrate dehydrogenase [Xylariomycetidae sp. FL0641]
MPSKETVLITGCSDGGIGPELALLFQQRGFHVFATARDLAKMSALQDLPDVTLLTLDVTKSAHIKAAVEAVTKHTGGTLNYLINNAGRNHFMPILDEDLDAVRNLFEINFFGPIAIVQAFSPLLIKAKGMAVYISSVSGYLNIAYMGTYAATKRATELVHEALRVELQPFGVDVLEVVTAGVVTRGQTYFGDFKLPEQSLYESIEDVIASRAQGNEGQPRMPAKEYATAVISDILERKTGRVWHGAGADNTKIATIGPVPDSEIDKWAVMGTGLDKLP